MRIVVNHLTRMGAPRICVAGIDQVTERHIRPTTPSSDPITRSLLVVEGGPFVLGGIVDLGTVQPAPSPPETEDHRFSTRAITSVGRLDPAEYLELLDRVGADNLESIFGPELEQRGRSFAIEEGHGTTSLGVLRLQEQLDLEIDAYGKLRLRFDDGGTPIHVGVTDLRFVEEDHRTLKYDVIEDVRQRLRGGVGAVLMVGLARAFTAAGDDRSRHWLQVNGICLEDRPLEDPS